MEKIKNLEKKENLEKKLEIDVLDGYLTVEDFSLNEHFTKLIKYKIDTKKSDINLDLKNGCGVWTIVTKNGYYTDKILYDLEDKGDYIELYLIKFPRKEKKYSHYKLIFPKNYKKAFTGEIVFNNEIKQNYMETKNYNLYLKIKIKWKN